MLILFLLTFQVRRHGAQDDARKNYWRRLFPVGCTGHRSPCSRHCVKLLKDISSEPEGRQEKGTKGGPFSHESKTV